MRMLDRYFPISKLFLIASFLNILDLITSYASFYYGAFETSKFMLFFHNSYVACLFAVMSYQVLLLALYFLSKIIRRNELLLVFSFSKFYAIINNLIVFLTLIA